MFTERNMLRLRKQASEKARPLWQLAFPRF
jgi:hypothetical protein